jgi:predicted regulator of Ras-like GTPase activity (Roadblock/LC7/MglB family)
VAVTDPFDGELLEALTLACDRPVRPCVGVLSEIDRALERQLGPSEPLVGVIVETPIERGRVDVLDDDRLRRQALAFAKGQLTELAGKWDVHFSANVLDKIVAHARAVPQTINAICRLATFTARLDGRRLITGDFVDQVARRLLDAPPGGVSRRGGQGNPVVIESGAWGQGETRARAAEPAIPNQPGRIIPLVEPESGQEPFMSRLDSLNKILKHLQSESPGVEASALISEDGLMIASSLPQDLDETRVAGMTATLLNLGTRAGTELRRGDVQEVIVRGEHGYSVMINAGRGALLLVLANEQTKLGLIFFDMREAIKSIKVIL